MKIKTQCPWCKHVHTVEAEYSGMQCDCPSCGKVFVIESLRDQCVREAMIRNANAKVAAQGHAGLCFALGMLFPVLGVVAAAIIDKERGFKYGLIGSLVDAVIGVLLYWLNWFLSVGMYL